MPSTLSIRFAGIDDLNTIGFLAHQIWPQTYEKILSAGQLDYMIHLFYSPSSLKNQIVAQKHIFIIVENGKEPVGFASYSQTGEPAIFKLHKLYVLPGQQGKGLGKTLVDFIVHDIRAIGASALQLNVNRNNQAKQFYERLGFTVVKEEDVDIGNDYFMNDYIMEKKLL